MLANDFKVLLKECVLEVLKEDLSSNQHGRYAQEAGAGPFDPREFGVNEDAKNEFLAKLGLGPNYVPKKKKTYNCPNCKGSNAIYEVHHEDTDMEENSLVCRECGYES